MKRSLQLLKTALRAQQQQRKTKKGRKQQQSEQQKVQNTQQLRDSQQDQLQGKKLRRTEKESERSSDANDKTSVCALSRLSLFLFRALGRNSHRCVSDAHCCMHIATRARMNRHAPVRYVCM